eukprot:355477-Chlamydomonas_euryale.AAC.2
MAQHSEPAAAAAASGRSAAEAAAVAAFEALGVCTLLAEAAAGLGWTSPSAIQEQAVPHLLAGEREHTHTNRMECERAGQQDAGLVTSTGATREM